MTRSFFLEHILFWLLSSIVLFRFFTLDFESGKVDYYYTFLFQIPLFIVVLLNYKLISYSFEKKKYITYLIGFIALLGMGILLHYLVFDHLSDLIFKDYLFYSIYSKNVVGQFVLAYLVVSLFVKLATDWFEIKENQLQIEKDNYHSQMNFLKAQLNPHFLFNCLNNIYGLMSLDVDKGKDNIIKLSDALRYMLYKTDAQRVPLESELEYLENYIELEKLRLESTEAVSVSFPEEVMKQEIAPLILLPFIENCFKHCDKENPLINIALEIKQGKLQLLCKNNVVDKSHEIGGLGLENGKKRLSLIYKDKYDLKIDEREALYYVTLTLDLDA